MVHSVTVEAGTTPTGGRHEFRVVCDRCGLVDKAGSEREAVAVALYHRAHGDRSRMRGV